MVRAALRLRRPSRLIAALLVAVAAAGAVQAQERGGFVTGTIQSPVLTIDPDRLYAESAYGRRVAEALDEQGAALAAENRRIEAELAAEERALTERRPEMAPEAFRAEAEAFDRRVMRIRREQDAKARALAARSDAARRTFIRAARPVLEEMMRESGAAVIVEARSVFMSLDAVDITEAARARIDATISPEIPETPEIAPPTPGEAPAEGAPDGPALAPPGADAP
ncbi:OmpH family outer membrane protein [Rhodosalinus sediminis]|uniref:OmpH family outer membrane protein n=1 Tax=Rhodosalinus sediminis TaxID=1940533 RepID=UPI002352FA31|nr:OmpH family outer membrane protein [Rhodosalinus sediminis]